jgi:uncharacterized protein (DUF1800 family)
MRFGRIKLVRVVLCISLSIVVPSLPAKKKEPAGSSGQNDHKRAVHALNRLTFGPRPGDIQRVETMGVDKWIELQLHPDKIQDNGMDSRLASFHTLRLSNKEIISNFPDQQLIRAVMDHRKSMPSDPATRAVYQVQIARLQEKKDRKAVAANEAATAPPASGAATDVENMQATTNNANAEGDTASNSTADSTAPARGMSEAAGSEASGVENSVPSSAEVKVTPEEEAEARRREDRLYADLEVQKLPDLPPDQRFKKILMMSTTEQVALADSLRGGKGQEFLAGMDPTQKETLLAMNNPPAVVVDELVQAKLLRAVYSERQLEGVMTDFWFNHFNVYASKGVDRLLLTSYERDVIRPRALGKFEDLLFATAKSPAMLFYLDNWLSVGPGSAQALGLPGRPSGPYGPYRRRPRNFPRPNPNAKRKTGLNENYGRELLELHTLSVNGGYSQRDVTEVAMVFTGWTIDKPYDGASFHFDPRMHEPGPKFVLGHPIKPKGEDEGREVLHRLATSPETAHFISLKLAQRFVSDDPPAPLVDRLAKVFLKKKGDIREVLSTLFHSPEFWADGAYRAKVKTPLEFVASALRATGAEVDDAMPLVRQLSNMGMPLYGCQPPTGYSMKSDAWVSSSALLNRMNFALALTGGKVRGVKMDAAQLGGTTSPPDGAGTLLAMEGTLLAGDVSKQTNDSIMAQIDGSGGISTVQSQEKKDNQRTPADAARPPDGNTIAGLLLGSPEFQKR